jgi:hypothetical protein
MSITETVKKIKDLTGGEMGVDIALVLIVLLTALGSFGLGRMSVGANTKDPVIIDRTNISGLMDKGQVSNSKGTSMTASTIKSSDTDEVRNTQPIDNSGKLIVASKRGKKYYFTWCSGAKNLSEANKIYFNTEEEAVKAGLSKSTSCK